MPAFCRLSAKVKSSKQGYTSLNTPLVSTTSTILVSGASHPHETVPSLPCGEVTAPPDCAATVYRWLGKLGPWSEEYIASAITNFCAYVQ